MEAIEAQLATLAARIEAEEAECDCGGTANSSAQSAVRMWYPNLNGLAAKKVALIAQKTAHINVEAARIKSEGELETALVNERAVHAGAANATPAISAAAEIAEIVLAAVNIFPLYFMSETIAPDFEASKLGTKSHWDEVYEREITNFEDHGDIGEIWFGEVPVVKMMDWVESNCTDVDVKTIDLGCGNGHILFEMSELGYTNLTGVDYSAASITLAQKIHANSHADASIEFEALDFMPFSPTNPPPEKYNATFQLAVDKGTFDAISLANGVVEGEDGVAVNAFDRAKVASKYAEAVACILESGGKLLITSCNWTEAELVEGFKAHFAFHSRKKYPTYTFGGVEGQQVVTVAFTKI
ncbi:hypothetical protein CcCBS67573_g05339 [Chytriomyces confervae]|uniref:Protein-lysine N-methyltransferase EFM4 n=1 Tax=Chytriomyces confervae TaxID=246404 RepID=A0A507FCU9_9FUNG|nr:hypothetical protein CcCBS67573_g05339 [Chytriomyces confervae]